MARKDTVRTELLISQSLAASFHGPATVVRNLDNCSYQINIQTSDSIGTFQVEASNDYEPGGPNNTAPNAGNWVPLTLGGGVPFVNAANDNIVIDLNQLPYNAIRLSYVSATAGTGHADFLLLYKQKLG